MVVDTSVLTAILLGERDAEQWLSLLIAHAGDLQVSAATLVETGMVAEARRGRAGARDLDQLFDRLAMSVVPVDEQQARTAVSGWRRFGVGRHPAGLNYGDCFAYALSTTTGQPLACKGEDFAATDVRRP